MRVGVPLHRFLTPPQGFGGDAESGPFLCSPYAAVRMCAFCVCVYVCVRVFMVCEWGARAPRVCVCVCVCVCVQVSVRCR